MYDDDSAFSIYFSEHTNEKGYGTIHTITQYMDIENRYRIYYRFQSQIERMWER